MRRRAARWPVWRWFLLAVAAAMLGLVTVPVAAQSDDQGRLSISGSVAFEGGQPAAGVTVDLFSGSDGVRENFLRATQTDSAGDYRFSVAPGRYILTFIAPVDRRFVGGSRWLQPDVPVTEGQSVEGVDAVLAGVESNTTISGEVTGIDGAPVPGLTIDLFTAQADGSRGRFLGDTQTDESGRYRHVTRDGCYVLTFIAPRGRTFVSGSPWHQPSVCLDGAAVTGINAQLGGQDPPAPPTVPTPSTPIPTSTPIPPGPSTTALPPTTRVTPEPTTTTVPRSTTRPTSVAPTTQRPITTTIPEPQPPACQERSRCSHPMTDAATQRLDVLSIRYLPDADRDGMIDFETTGYRGTVESLRERISAVENEGLWWNTEATRPMGSANPDAVPELGFRRVLTVEVLDAVPVGKPFRNAFRPNYDHMLSGVLAVNTNRQICEHVEAGVKEVWIWTQHTDVIEPAESVLSSAKIGDVSNSERTLGLSLCDRPYTVYNYNFTRGAAEMLHNRGHQAEALIRHHQPGGRPDPLGAAFEENCGNVHFPPNAVEDYDYTNPVAVQSTCDGWRDDSSATTSYTCATHFAWTYGDPTCFGDGGLAYSIWWFQRFPAESGGSLAGEPVGNWWDLFSDLHRVGDPPGRQPQPGNWLR